MCDTRRHGLPRTLPRATLIDGSGPILDPEIMRKPEHHRGRAPRRMNPHRPNVAPLTEGTGPVPARRALALDHHAGLFRCRFR